jgi:ribonucleoside-triphosphate reductase (thioredoxin)
MKPNDTTIFSFPMKAPEGCVLRDDLDSFTHLRLWLAYQRHWCEHKPSVTVYVKEEDWPAVGAWVWKHFDEISGISFLPWDGGSYRQAPYEEINEEHTHFLRQLCLQKSTGMTLLRQTIM